MIMAPMKSSCLCFAVGVVVLASSTNTAAAAAAASSRPGSSPVYSLQGGGSGMEQGGDYVENKIARGLQGAFGAAADEAKHANRHIKDAAKSARGSVRESGKHVRGAAKSARESVNFAGKIGWPFDANKATEGEAAPAKLSWVGGAREEVTKEGHTVAKFFRDPNHAFVAQGIVAVVFGVLHLLKYDEFTAKIAEPLCNLLGVKFGAVTPVLSHVRLVGAYLAGVLVSDILAYKSNSAGFKRGKVFHEMGAGIALSLVCLKDLLSSEDAPADMLPHGVAAVIFAAWYAFLSQNY